MSAALIVAPHSACGPAGTRDCDRVARQAAEIMAAAEPSWIAATHLADRLRIYGDYNRGVAYFSHWRLELRALVNAIGPAFMIEAHSFPPDTRGWQGADLVLFASPFNKSWIDALARAIVARTPINVRIAQAGDANSIMYEFGPYVPHVLVEFNEDGRNLEVAARALVGAAKQLVESGGARARAQKNGRDGAQPTADQLIIAVLVVLVLLILLYWSTAVTNESNQRWVSFE